MVKCILPEDGEEIVWLWAEQQQQQVCVCVYVWEGSLLILLNSIAFFSLWEFILATGDTQQRLEP